MTQKNLIIPLLNNDKIEIQGFHEQTPEIENAFITLNSSYFSTGSNKDLLKEFLPTFYIELGKYLETIREDTKLQDECITNLTNIWQYLRKNNYLRESLAYLQNILRFIISWEEKENSRIHKGTLLYHLGGTCNLLSQFDQGFLYIHEAYQEDKITQNTLRPNTPSFSFITLDNSNKNNYWYDSVNQISDYLTTIIDHYRNNNVGVLTSQQFKEWFLTITDLSITFLFSYTLAKLLVIKNSFKYDGVFSAQYKATYIFNLMQIIENAIKHKHNLVGTFYNQAGILIRNITSDLQSENDLITIKNDIPQELNTKLHSLIDRQYVFNNRPLQDIDSDIVITYLLRNDLAHSSTPLLIMNDKFDEIQQSVFNVLFKVVETFYDPAQ